MTNTSQHILLVDDDDSVREILSAHLRRGGHEVTAFGNPFDALEAARKEHYDLLVTDIRMKGMDGIALLKSVKAARPELPVLMITGHGTIESAVESMKLGAFDYVTKPVGRDEFLHIVANALRLHSLEDENARLRGELRRKYAFEEIVGKGEAMAGVFALLEKVIDSDATVLVLGESGTGKELVARAVHYNGPRASKPFVAVNCASVPETLMESELFGHVRGAFTGAHRDREGKIRRADGGTLFLDEIGDLKPDLQAKLLRVLQEGEVERVGEGIPRPVDLRVIAATHRDLDGMLESGDFREDLYYRIAVYPIRLPPLRERRADIPLLVCHFLEKHAKGTDARFSAESMEILRRHAWPGNVRELENVVERALILQRGGELGPDTLPAALREREASPTAPLEIPEEGIDLEAVEKALIRRALERAGGNQSKAARLLGLTRPTLIYRLEKYGLREAGD